MQKRNFFTNLTELRFLNTSLQISSIIFYKMYMSYGKWQHWIVQRGQVDIGHYGIVELV